jgi:hypothetical protein
LGLGNGTFGTHRRVFIGVVRSEPFSVAVGEFDGDGFEDLAMANIESNDVSVLWGLGDGNFSAQSRFAAGFRPVSVAAGDFNGDDFQDLAVANLGSHNVSVLLNQSAPSNQPPVAVAGPDARIECTSPAGSTAMLDGSASADSDSTPGTNDDIVSFEWFENLGLASEVLLGAGETFAVTLFLGAHVITLRTTDRSGATATDDVVITVADTIPPTLALVLTPALLWPPNHRMVEVVASVVAGDLCGAARVVLGSISSSEPDDADETGDGATLDDIQLATAGQADFTFQLRAERAGGGRGRIYTVTYLASDPTGNVSAASSEVVVPHDQAGLTEPLLIGIDQSRAGASLGARFPGRTSTT